MEYAGGGELYTYVHQNGKLTEDISRPIFAQLVSAVTHLVSFFYSEFFVSKFYKKNLNI